MATKAQIAERDEALERLREWLEPGDTVYTILRHVSRSGMSRSISVVRDSEDGPHDFTYLAARVLGYRVDERNGGLKAGGCGMDMGFHVVYSLSSRLFPNGFECIGEGDSDRWGSRCPSNDHSNGDRDYSPHHHSSGGYALRHEWL
jgi:hypothetical protein